MESSNLSSLIIFSVCSIINENSIEINHFYKKPGNRVINIKNEKKIKTLKDNVNEIKKDLFK